MGHLRSITKEHCLLSRISRPFRSSIQSASLGFLVNRADQVHHGNNKIKRIQQIKCKFKMCPALHFDKDGRFRRRRRAEIRLASFTFIRLRRRNTFKHRDTRIQTRIRRSGDRLVGAFSSSGTAFAAQVRFREHFAFDKRTVYVARSLAPTNYQFPVYKIERR